MAVSQYQELIEWTEDTNRSTPLIDEVPANQLGWLMHGDVDGTFSNLYQLVHKLVHHQYFVLFIPHSSNLTNSCYKLFVSN